MRCVRAGGRVMAGPTFSWIQFAAAIAVAMVSATLIVSGTLWSARRTFERNIERERRVWLFAVLAELNLDRHAAAQMRDEPSLAFPLERGVLDQAISHLADVPPQVIVAIQRAALFIGRYNAAPAHETALLDDVIAPLEDAALAVADYLRDGRPDSTASLSDDEIRDWGLANRA